MSSRVWFITGITGFVGGEMMRRILERTDDRVIGLARAASEDSLRSRFDKLMTTAFGSVGAGNYRDRIELVRGELTSPRMGLDQGTYQRVVSQVTHVVHCGASVRFDLPLDEAREINVGGTERAIELADAVPVGQLQRLAYVGTCYVAGDRTDVVGAEELDVGQGFRNSYEQTKCESEKLVRAAMERLPVMIFRPSIIVGDSRTGKTPSFNVIYWPVRIYAQGWWKERFIGNLDAPADVVPINFVCDAMLHILERDDCLGRCFPLAAGLECGTTNHRIIELASEFFDQPMPEIIDPAEFTDEVRAAMWERLTPAQRNLVSQGRNYVPYFAANPLFDNSATMAVLEGTDLAPPRVEDYFTNLFDYCKRTNWGRKAR